MSKATCRLDATPAQNPIVLARSAFRAGSLVGLCLVKWNSQPHFVCCFKEQWRADWFALRWQQATPSQFTSKHGSFCVAIPVAPYIKFPFQNAGLSFGPSGQWRQWAVGGGVKEFKWVINSLQKL